MKLLECFSLWPYMRLLIVFYLVIPHFDGALYVYKHLICPCLSMDPQIIFSLFKMRKESLVRENFLSEVERYVKENGYEGLEKFISSKSTKSNIDGNLKAVSTMDNDEPNGGQNDIKAVQILVKKKETTANQVSEAEPILTVNKDRSSAMQIKEKTVEVAADRRILETPPSKKVQKELTAVSVLATQTDAKNIEVAADRGILKTLPQKKVQKEWTAISPLPTQTDAKTIEVAAERGILKTPPPKKVQGELTAVCPLPIQTDATFDFPLGGNIHKATYEAVKINNEAKPNLTLTENHTVPTVKINEKPVEVGIGMEHPQSPKQVQKEWTCALCQVTTTCETNLNSHLQGRKHKASYDALKARNQAFVPTIAPASTAKTSDQPNKEPEKSIPSRGLKQKVTSNEHVQAQPKFSPLTKLNKPKEALVDCVSSNGLKGKIAIHLDKVQSQQPKPNSSLWCALCSIRCAGETDMMCHLKGRKHNENEQRQENLIKVAEMNKPRGICDTATGEFDIFW
ncbi:PREDICTED: uncharacterized protein LOC101305618 [Fragaria vesca subsp. vesca]